MTLRWLMAKLGYVPKAELDEKKTELRGLYEAYGARGQILENVNKRLALYETPHRHPVCVSCSKPVKRGQNYKVLFVRHEDCGGNNGE